MLEDSANRLSPKTETLAGAPGKGELDQGSDCFGRRSGIYPSTVVTTRIGVTFVSSGSRLESAE
ncbi:hypothetical protein acdb102_33500 [Acidothermaceae bacterium B102]|nr:hypothetical protein acdb102_33500 [Acidothermaceae bacterium B102]